MQESHFRGLTRVSTGVEMRAERLFSLDCFIRLILALQWSENFAPGRIYHPVHIPKLPINNTGDFNPFRGIDWISLEHARAVFQSQSTFSERHSFDETGLINLFSTGGVG